MADDIIMYHLYKRIEKRRIRESKEDQREKGRARVRVRVRVRVRDREREVMKF